MTTHEEQADRAFAAIMAAALEDARRREREVLVTTTPEPRCDAEYDDGDGDLWFCDRIAGHPDDDAAGGHWWT